MYFIKNLPTAGASRDRLVVGTNPNHRASAMNQLGTVKERGAGPSCRRNDLTWRNGYHVDRLRLELDGETMRRDQLGKLAARVAMQTRGRASAAEDRFKRSERVDR